MLIYAFKKKIQHTTQQDCVIVYSRVDMLDHTYFMFDCPLRPSSIKSFEFFIFYWCHITGWDWKTTCAPIYGVSITEILGKNVALSIESMYEAQLIQKSILNQAAFCWSLQTHVTNLNPFENLSPTCKISNHLDSYENDWILPVKIHRTKGKCVWPLWMLLFRLYNMSPLRSWVRVKNFFWHQWSYFRLYNIHPIVFAMVYSTDTILSYSNIITDKQK